MSIAFNTVNAFEGLERSLRIQGYENASPMVEYREILSSEQIDSIVNFLMEQKP